MYILVAKDSLTKWIEIFALISDKEAYTVATCIADEVFYRHGAARLVITDQGTEFTAHLVQQLMTLTGSRHIKTTPANPRANGQVENQNRTLRDTLSAYVSKHQTDWDDYLALVAFDYRTTINSATGYTPFFLLYGREANRISEEHMDDMLQSLPQPPASNVQDLYDTMRFLWEQVGKQNQSNVEAMQPRRREPLVFREFNEGDYVFLKHVPRRFYRDDIHKKRYKLSRKLQVRYVGPYRIINKFSPVVYQVEINNKLKTVHAINMKRW